MINGKTNFTHISISSYPKALKETDMRTTNTLVRVLKSATTPFRALVSLKLFQKAKTLLDRLNFLNKLPFGVLVMFWLVAISLVILVANHLRYEFFVDLIIKNFPEAVTVPADSTGKPLYMSALDRMFAEFEAEINVGYFIFFIVGLRMFLKKVWMNYNPRKLQVLRS